jgi:hypothetical protein
MNRNVWATIAATVAVVAVAILGFREMGGPGTQRLKQGDLRIVQSLARAAQQVNEIWRRDKTSLPKDLETFPERDRKDPLSGQIFRYHVKAGSEYELCATFALDDREAAQSTNMDEFWLHPKGDYCFQLDSSRTVPNAPYY